MDEGLGPSLSQEEELEKEERIKRLAPLAKDVVLVLVKTIKATKMYLPNNPIYLKFREEMKEKFDAFFKDEELLSFRVKRFELTFLDQDVYSNPDKEDNIALMFFKDGIREFCFHRGITPEEIEGFIDILKFGTKDRELDDDLVTLLWEKDFQSITYTVTDEGTGEEAEEDILFAIDEEPEAIRQLEELRSRAIRDVDAGPEGLVESGQAVSAGEALGFLDGEPAEGEDYEAIRGSYQPPDDLSLLTELTEVFCEILLTEHDSEHFEAVTQSLSKALEIFVGRGDLALATILVMKVQELAQDPRLSGSRPVLDKILAKAGSEPVIKQVGEFIDQGGMEAMESAGSYLMQLDARALDPILALLETLNSRKARKALCDIIVVLCNGSGRQLLPYLTHRYWFVVRNVVLVLGKLADPEAVPAIGGALKHADARVRREALHALYSIKGDKAEDLLAENLYDADRFNRVLSAKLLAEMAPGKAYDALMAMVSGKEFEDKEFEEKRDFFELLGKSGGEKSVPFFEERFTKKGVFRSAKREQTRACAAYGLAAAGGEEAYGLLKSEIDSKSKALRAACLDGLRRMGRR